VPILLLSPAVESAPLGCLALTVPILLLSPAVESAPWAFGTRCRSPAPRTSCWRYYPP